MNIHYGTWLAFEDPCDQHLLKFYLKLAHPVSVLPLSTWFCDWSLRPGSLSPFLLFIFQNGKACPEEVGCILLPPPFTLLFSLPALFLYLPLAWFLEDVKCQIWLICCNPISRFNPIKLSEVICVVWWLLANSIPSYRCKNFCLQLLPPDLRGRFPLGSWLHVQSLWLRLQVLQISFRDRFLLPPPSPA